MKRKIRKCSRTKRSDKSKESLTLFFLVLFETEETLLLRNLASLLCVTVTVKMKMKMEMEMKMEMKMKNNITMTMELTMTKTVAIGNLRWRRFRGDGN